jgi:RNA polymerase sigma factor for flagellar operon FliA
MRDLRGLDIGSFASVPTEDSAEEDLSNYIPAAPQTTPLVIFEQVELKQLLLSVLDQLPGKEGRVIYLYYFEELSMKEIGEALGVGESRISQIHSAAMTRLRVMLLEADGEHPLRQYVWPGE